MSDPLFADSRADRMPVNGTVQYSAPRPGEPKLDDHFLLGYTWVNHEGSTERTASFFDTFPSQIKLDDAFIHRGQQRFNIYCAPCHGLDGSGNGLVNIRAHQLKESLWVTPADLHSALVRSRPVGHIYNTINVGIRNMPPYGPQIVASDRWAIVAYVRALQLSQNAAPAALPPEVMQGLK
jgi:mono/diheme cytochrome c family protein